jgi:hypothetical protein
MRRAGIIICLAMLIVASEAHAREFGSYDCSDDCSGHAAGYRWAEAHAISSDSDCPLRGRAISVYEGCLVYVADPSRGAPMRTMTGTKSIIDPKPSRGALRETDVGRGAECGRQYGTS